MPLGDAHLLDALDCVRRGDLGTFRSPSLSHYVLDPRDEEPWDLKAVVGLAMERAGLPIARGQDRLTDSRQMQIHMQRYLPAIGLVSFVPPRHRRIGLGLNNPDAADVDWSEAMLEPVANVTSVPKIQSVEVLRRVRAAWVRQQALWRAAGICGDCELPAPFHTPRGQPFLEVHHILPIASGGDDVPGNVIALCPNCHRKRHHGPGGLDA
jgi:hypothetical protein